MIVGHIRRKPTSGDFKKTLHTVIAHNKQLAQYAATQNAVIKATHLRCAQQHEKMRLAILPESIRIRAMLAEICTMLGPFCYEKPAEKKEGTDNAGGCQEDGKEVADSGCGDGRNSKQQTGESGGRRGP